MKGACENCEYSEEIVQDAYATAWTTKTCVMCRRYPPQLGIRPIKRKTVEVDFFWPVVKKIDFCGEYKPKQED